MEHDDDEEDLRVVVVMEGRDLEREGCLLERVNLEEEDGIKEGEEYKAKLCIIEIFLWF